MVSAFFIYAVQQLWHSSIVFVNAAGYYAPFPLSTYGIIDLFTMSLMGLGMIMWLLENEHKTLTRTNNELDSFLYSTSHDLRAPIASVLGLTHLGKLDSKDEVAHDYFNKIEQRVKKLDAIFGDILNYSKSAKMAIEINKLNFQEIVNGIFSQLQFANGQTNINLIMDDTAPQYFLSDQQQIEIILNNLIGNAIKYQNPQNKKPFVKATLTTENKNVVITISDNGLGINEEAITKIFTMFYRASYSTEGSGLGLFIAQEAANKINGKIEVKSSEGKGASFTLTLQNAAC